MSFCLDYLKYECYGDNVIYKYEDALKVKRELFGSSSVLEKKYYVKVFTRVWNFY